jgi:hypothetical protein
LETCHFPDSEQRQQVSLQLTAREYFARDYLVTLVFQSYPGESRNKEKGK